MNASLLFSMQLLGCGDDSSELRCEGAYPNRIRASFVGDHPAFAALRTGTDPWISLEPRVDDYEFCASDNYVFVLVCSGSTSTALAFARTQLDGSAFEIPGCGGETERVEISGEMAQEGSVYIAGSADSGSTSPWSFVVRVPKGKHDVIASDAYPQTSQTMNRVVIRRDRSFLQDTVEPNIDLALGTQLNLVALDVTGLESDDTISTSVSLTTANAPSTQISLSKSTAALRLPASALLASDTERVRVSSVSPTVQGTWYSRSTSTPGSTVELMPRMTGVTIDGDLPAVATWTSLPSSYDAIVITEVGAGSSPPTRIMRATRPWVDALNATSLSFDLDIPGFATDWMFASEVHVFSASAEQGAVSSVSSFNHTLP